MRRAIEHSLLVLMLIVSVVVILSAEAFMAMQYRRQLREIEETQQQIQQLREENESLRQRMQQWLDEWDVMTVEVTAYAPLDPAAVPGMCYAGDPAVTASGAPVQPGLTVAAGPGVPFGSKVWVAGAMREIQDRGGRIGPGSLDICMESKAEALRFGRQRAIAVFRKGM